jgi:para-nitrobenzyl esterase
VHAYTVVPTSGGRIRGIRANGVDTFLGIPYGQPTAGKARFLAPVAAKPTKGVRDAFWFGPGAPQVDSRLGVHGLGAELMTLMYPRGSSPLEAGPMSEDSLVLNVWSPAAAEHFNLPVMVWFHGGGFSSGTGAESVFYGETLAKSGRAVVVTVNHRLGILGYTPLGHLLGSEYSTSGSAGIADLVLALQWVQDNISGFGGDPENVTIFGQSGGGAKVFTLLGMPATQGLFAKAIIQSGVFGAFNDPEAGVAYTSALLDSLGIPESNADVLLDLPLAHLLEGQRRFQRTVGNFAPTIDGSFLPESLLSTRISPLASGIPVIIGYTSHDMAMMLTFDPDYATLTFDTLPNVLARDLGDGDVSLIESYRSQFPAESAQLILSRIATDHSFGRAALAAAELKSLDGTADVFVYEFGYQTEALNGLLGSCHSLDLPFVFGNVSWSPFAGERPERHSVAASMMSAWLDFAEQAIPRTPSGDPWPRYSRGTGRMRTVIDVEWSTTAGDNVLAEADRPNRWAFATSFTDQQVAFADQAKVSIE